MEPPVSVLPVFVLITSLECNVKHPLSVLEDVLMEGCASTELAIVLIHTQDMPV
jgi:hypothetical protein